MPVADHCLLKSSRTQPITRPSADIHRNLYLLTYPTLPVHRLTGCRCGNAWIGGPLYPDSSCKTPCTGNANETCGDSYMTTELYNTSVALPQVQADIAARPIGWSGCFADQDGTVFPDYSRTDMSNSVERCKATCKGLSYTWSGVDNVYCECCFM